MTLLHRDSGALACLAGYFALSVTNLPPMVILFPLFFSGIFLMIEADVSDTAAVRQRDFAALVIAALFLISYVASVLFSNDFFRSVNAVAILFPGLLIAYVLIRLSPIYLRHIAWCLTLLVLAPSCVVMLMFMDSSLSVPELVFNKKRTPALVVPNDMLMGVIFLPVVVATFFIEKQPVLKIVAIVIVALLILTVYVVGSRVCILTIVLMVVLSIYRFRPKQFLVNSLIFLLLLISTDILLELGIVERMLRFRHENARLSIWLAGLMRWTDHPFLGFGPANFEIAYRLGLSSVEMPDWVLVDSRRMSWAHNIFIEALLERGVIGLAGQSLLFLLIYFRLRERLTTSHKELKIFYFALFVSYLGFIFAGLFELTLQRIWVVNALFVFFGLACARVTVEKQRLREPRESIE